MDRSRAYMPRQSTSKYKRPDGHTFFKAPFKLEDQKRLTEFICSYPELLLHPSPPMLESPRRKRIYNELVKMFPKYSFSCEEIKEKIIDIRRKYVHCLKQQLNAFDRGMLDGIRWCHFENVDRILRNAVCKEKGWTDIRLPKSFQQFMATPATIAPSVSKATEIPMAKIEIKIQSDANLPMKAKEHEKRTIPEDTQRLKRAYIRKTWEKQEGGPITRAEEKRQYENEILENAGISKLGHKPAISSFNDSSVPVDVADELFCKHLGNVMKLMSPGRKKSRMQLQLQQIVMQYIEP